MILSIHKGPAIYGESLRFEGKEACLLSRAQYFRTRWDQWRF